MHDYEIFIEEINPCGGEKHSQKALIEAEAADINKGKVKFTLLNHISSSYRTIFK